MLLKTILPPSKLNINYLRKSIINSQNQHISWTASSEFGTYRVCEQRRFRRACASAQSRQNLRCTLIQAVSQEEPSDRKPEPWPLWMAGHAQLKFVMTECSKTKIRLTGLSCGFTARCGCLWSGNKSSTRFIRSTKPFHKGTRPVLVVKIFFSGKTRKFLENFFFIS